MEWGWGGSPSLLGCTSELGSVSSSSASRYHQEESIKVPQRQVCPLSAPAARFFSSGAGHLS